MTRLSKEREDEIFERISKGQSNSSIAAEMQLNRRTVINRKQTLLKLGFDASIKGVAKTEKERLGADFWRKRFNGLKKEHSELEHLFEEISGIVSINLEPADWLIDKKRKSENPIVPAVMCSDLHIGEVVDPNEIDGMNAYNVEIFKRRYRQLIQACVEEGKRQVKGRDCPGFIYMRGGDTISGDIHDELKETNELTSHEQVYLAVQEEARGIQILADEFGKVFVPCVAGNHGRITHKPKAKKYAATNYDTLISKLLADQFKNDPRVTFQIPNSIDALFPVFGWQYLLTHGDNLGSRGGTGFIGAEATIIRGAHKLRQQQANSGKPIDYLVHGHFHTSSNPQGHISNGSMVGYGEYARGLRLRPEPPQQYFFTTHGKWGMTYTLKIQLEEPRRNDKPKVFFSQSCL